MIIDQAVYRDGQRHSCPDLSDALDSVRADGVGFVWVGLKDPTPEEFALVDSELQLHPLAVEDAVRGNQRPKIEAYGRSSGRDATGRSLFVVLHTLRYIESTSDIESGEVMVFLGDRFVVTVRRGEGNPLAGVRQRLEQDPKHLAHGPAVVLHAVMDSVVDTYLSIDVELQADLDAIEAQVFSVDDEVDAAVIYRLKREVLEFRRAAVPLGEAMHAFHSSQVYGLIDPEVLVFFRDVEDHLARVNDHTRTYDRLLSDVLNAHLAHLSVRQNNDMRKITAWVAIVAVPTMVAGIYGMNFDWMPELRWQWGYPTVLLFMASACLLLFRKFKASGWL